MGGAHLGALWALAVIQPLLSLLGSNPEFFVARDNTGGQIVIFAVLITFAPPLVATGIEALLNLISTKARWFFHLALMALLFALLVIQVFKQIADGPAVPMLIVAGLAGLCLAWFYGYGKFLRSLTDILIPAPAVILIVFLFFSQSFELVTGSGNAEPLDVQVGNPAPVVMVIFDEFPAGSLMTPDDQVNKKRFPNFAELAEQSDWYRDTTTGGSYTTIAVPSILSGLEPERDKLPTAHDHPNSIFTLLGKTYDVDALEPITQVCPESLCPPSGGPRESFAGALESLVTDSKVVEQHLLLPEDMGVNFPDISQTFGGFADPGITVEGEDADRTRAREFVAGQHLAKGGAMDAGDETSQLLDFIGPSKDGRPAFDYGHIEKPHYPWNHYPDGTVYGVMSKDFRGFIPDEVTWTGNRYVTDRATQAHLLEVGYVDHLMGMIIKRLKEQGVWDESLVVVTADHGGALLTGEPRREADVATMGEVASVPLFIKSPGQISGRLITRPTCTVEILPIIAKELETEMPWEPSPCNRSDVTVDNGTGPLVSLPTSTVLEQRQTYVDRVASLFGPGTGWSNVLKVGPNQDLIGSPLKSLNVASGEPKGAVLPDFDEAGQSNYVPGAALNSVLRQRGKISGVEDGEPLAIAVNGKVRAVGRAYLDAGQMTYSILLPQNSVRAGPNDIRVFTVGRSAGEPLLSPLGGPGEG
ncbi:MAG: sulfatase-like hydrolase/transferase [Solirubrobacterales bacterium]|nr:sulfatase-like hydrolase/transferase [Solirubrobacterales bacterium]